MALTTKEIEALRKITKARPKFDKDQICRDRIAGMTYQKIADKHRCSNGTAQRIVKDACAKS